MNHRRQKPKLNRVCKTATYTVDEAARTLNVHKNTVRHWIAQGLELIDRQKPSLIYGATLYAYLRQRSQARKRPCSPGTFFCLKCRAPRKPLGGMVDAIVLNEKNVQIKSLCEDCGKTMNRLSSLSKLVDRLKSFDQVTLLNPHLIERLPPSLNCYLKKED